MVEMYRGLPAYAISSIATKENEYEVQRDNPPGIHLVEAADFAHNWANLANPSRKKPTLREAALLNAAKNDYDRAVELGMVRPDAATPGWFEICRIKSVVRPGTIIQTLKTEEFEKYIAGLGNKTLEELSDAGCIANCAAELLDEGVIEYRPLSHVNDSKEYLPPAIGAQARQRWTGRIGG